MQDLHDSANLDTLAARTIKLGRDLAYKARALDLGGTAEKAAFVTRLLAPLENRQAFNSADEASLAAIQFEPKAACPTTGSADLCLITTTPIADVVSHCNSQVWPSRLGQSNALAQLDQ